MKWKLGDRVVQSASCLQRWAAVDTGIDSDAVGTVVTNAGDYVVVSFESAVWGGSVRVHSHEDDFEAAKP